MIPEQIMWVAPGRHERNACFRGTARLPSNCSDWLVDGVSPHEFMARILDDGG